MNYEEHKIIRSGVEGHIGWDILIRMELLKPIENYFGKAQATQYDVLRMWDEITDALMHCEKHKILHRDIKPANILVSETGVFKLSDFGEAKQTLQAQQAYTCVGTKRYMAPEVFYGKKYDIRADMYSLGTVIYYFLNVRRTPFLPLYPREISEKDIESAQDRRLRGEQIPGIQGINKKINEVLLKSLAYRPECRYRSFQELHNSISEILQLPEIGQTPLNSNRISTPSPISGNYVPLIPPKKNHVILGVMASVMLFVMGVAVFYFGQKEKKDRKIATAELRSSQEQIVSEQFTATPISPIILYMTPSANANGYVGGGSTQIILNGSSMSGRKVHLYINDILQKIEFSGEWEHIVQLQELQDQALNSIYACYEDELHQGETLEFYLDTYCEIPQLPKGIVENAESISGFAEPGAEIRLTANDQAFETNAKTDASFQFEGIPRLTAGDEIDLRVKDAAGNNSVLTYVVEMGTAMPVSETIETATPEPIVTPGSEATLEPTPTLGPTAALEPIVIIIPYGESYVFEVEISDDGRLRQTTDFEMYEKLSFALSIKRNLITDNYLNQYGKNNMLAGQEACIEFELTLNEYLGSTEIIPENLFNVTLENGNGVVERGYQLTGTENEEKNNVSIATNLPQLFYKRYEYSDTIGNITYLCVTTYVNGGVQKMMFEVGNPEISATLEPAPTPTPTPTALVYGKIISPNDGAEVDADSAMGITGWILVSGEVNSISLYADILSEGTRISSVELTERVSAMGKNTYEKRVNKFETEIVAAEGYEIKGRCPINDIPSGEYVLSLRLVDEQNNKEMIFETIEISIISGRTQSIGSLIEQENEPVKYDVNREVGFAIGLDDAQEGCDYPANQIIMSGWLNAAVGTNFSVLLEIDGQLYSREEINNMNGEISITRASRNLKSIDSTLRGEEIYDSKRAGFILNLNLPFLSSGTHDIAVTCNVAVPNQEATLVDLTPFTIIVDNDIAINELAIDELIQNWLYFIPQ